MPNCEWILEKLSFRQKNQHSHCVNFNIRKTKQTLIKTNAISSTYFSTIDICSKWSLSGLKDTLNIFYLGGGVYFALRRHGHLLHGSSVSSQLLFLEVLVRLALGRIEFHLSFWRAARLIWLWKKRVFKCFFYSFYGEKLLLVSLVYKITLFTFSNHARNKKETFKATI